VAIRLLGESYSRSDERIGYVIGAVSIGENSFIGDSSVIFPGAHIGRGCLVNAGSIVTRSVPDFSIVSGAPAKVVGQVVDIDNFFDNDAVKETYFDTSVLEKYQKDSI
jgi:acetyltransferase-like isoleucine patch superfamily enzyme